MKPTTQERLRLKQLEHLNNAFGGPWYWLTELVERGRSEDQILRAARAIVRVRYAAWVLAAADAEVEAWNTIRGAITTGVLAVWWEKQPGLVQRAWPAEGA